MEAVLVFISLFVVIFGIAYLAYTTRHKERLALIEKGADASIFTSKTPKTTPPIWKILILNLALILIGIGLGIFTGSMLHYSFGLPLEIAMPGTIFSLSGAGLLTGFYLTKNMK